MLCFVLTLLSTSSAFALDPDSVGYFWHISDLHFDPYYWDKDGSCRRNRVSEPRQLGEHSCDAPWSLLQSAVQAMSQEHGENLEFILWTGDGVSENVRTEEERFEALRNVTDLLGRYFSSEFIFPVLGETEPPDYGRLGVLWRHWLPTEALNTFNHSGYYSIEQKSRKLRVIVLNTNLWTKEEGGDPGGQWSWLEMQLDKAQGAGQTIYLVGHIAPGCDERQGAPPRPSLAEPHNSRYISLVSRHSRIVTGQFFGHLHSDTFRLLYGPDGDPVSSIFIAPSVTPKRTSSGANNPGLRLYKIESETGKNYECVSQLRKLLSELMAEPAPRVVLDFTQYYLDLERVSKTGEENWTEEYNFTSYYGLEGMSPIELHDLVQMFPTEEGVKYFKRYWYANSVRTYDLPSKGSWKTAHYCAITQIDYSHYHQCVDKRTSALAASRAMQSDAATHRLHAELSTHLLALVIASGLQLFR